MTIAVVPPLLRGQHGVRLRFQITAIAKDRGEVARRWVLQLAGMAGYWAKRRGSVVPVDRVTNDIEDVDRLNV